MPFALIIAGLVAIVAGVRGTQGDLWNTVQGEWFPTDANKHGFIIWAFAILVLGAVGYVDSLRKLSNAMLVLLIIVLLISNKGFFTKFNSDVLGVSK